MHQKVFNLYARSCRNGLNKPVNLKISALKLLALLVSGCFCVVSKAAEFDSVSEAAADQKLTLDPIVIVASKSPRPQSEVAAQVTVIDAQEIESAMAEDLDGLLKYEPGIDLRTDSTRFGASEINIRGIGGNRVAIEIDGVPVTDRFSIGDYSNSGRGLVEVDRIKRVEVLYGPASVMYGSDALGGVVSISTWDPDDLLVQTDRAAWLGIRGGYQSANDSWVGSALTAWGKGAHGLLAAASLREGHELENQAKNLPSDPQDWNSEDYMFRYTWDTPHGNRFRFSSEKTERDVVTVVNSQLGYGRRYRNTTALKGDDHQDSSRLSLDYEFAAGDWRQGTLRVYNVRQSTDQLTLEERAGGLRPVDIMRQFYYRQNLSGAEFNLFRDITWGASLHRVGLGAEWKQKDITEMRDSLQTSLTDGSSTNVILGEEMPVRDFPISRTNEYSVFMQDEISLSGGLW